MGALWGREGGDLGRTPGERERDLARTSRAPRVQVAPRRCTRVRASCSLRGIASQRQEQRQQHRPPFLRVGASSSAASHSTPASLLAAGTSPTPNGAVSGGCVRHRRSAFSGSCRATCLRRRWAGTNSSASPPRASLPASLFFPLARAFQDLSPRPLQPAFPRPLAHSPFRPHQPPPGQPRARDSKGAVQERSTTPLGTASQADLEYAILCANSAPPLLLEESLLSEPSRSVRPP